MKTKYKQWLRPLFLSLLWLLIGSPVMWGQTKIKKASNTETVHTRTQTVYVNGSRELYVPELRINNGVDDKAYQWYVHWYLEGEGTLSQVENFTLDADIALKRGGSVNTGVYKSTLKTCEGNGFWWYSGFFEKKKGSGTTDSPYEDYASCASAIKYSFPKNGNSNSEIRVICDVSNYANFSYENNTFTEPYLLKRYVFVIKSIDDYPTEPEVYNIDFPKGSSKVNFSMRSTPENYFWKEDSGTIRQGMYFTYSINNVDKGKFKLSGTNLDIPSLQVQQIDLSNYTSTVTVKVYASNENSTSSNPVAIYYFNPVEDAGFMVEDDVTDDRKPEKNKALYQLVGVVDFDLNNIESSITKENNISANSLDNTYTTYGFLKKDIKRLGDGSTNSQNMYGLFRSANSESSKNETTIGDNKYLWIPATGTGESYYAEKALYDRTYVNSNGTESGFFYYIDASDDPGTLVDVPINGTLCASTELTVVAWVADMTRASKAFGLDVPLPPNINLVLKGKKYDDNNNFVEEKILHQFTSGDALTDYTGTTKYSGKDEALNNNLMQWQQLCYKVRLDDLVGYSDFHLEVQNNEPHTDGADYAIDDVRIYKTLPAIEAFQTDLCEESNGTITTYLKLRTPYNLLLRNLGLEELNEEPISTWTQASADLDDGYKHGHHPRHYHMYYTVTYEEHKDWKYLDLDYHNNPKEGNNTPEEKSGIYGTSIISANMEDMPTAIMMGTMERHQSLAWLEEENGTVYVVFDNIPIHKHKKVTVAGEVLDEYYETLELGRDYFIQIFPQAGPSSGRDTPDKPCAIATKFTVHKSLELKYGEVQLEDVTILEPGNTITGVLRYQDKQSLEWTTVPNAEFDWYYGPTDGIPAWEDITSMLKKLL